MKIAIMTDTNSGISIEEADNLGIFCLPMPVIIDEINYIEDVNLTHDMFFKMLAEGRDASTSQPSPGDVLDMWNGILDKGYDQVVYIPMSSGLSSSATNAIGYADDYEGKVFVADNTRISVTLRQAVLDAKAMADEGMSGAEIKNTLEERAKDCIIYLAVDNLEHLKRTGRVNATAATVGSVLNIKPILKTDGGAFEVNTVVRGSKKVMAKMIDTIHEELRTTFKDVPVDELSIGVAGSFVSREDTDNWFNSVKEEFSHMNVFYDDLSCSISTHTGPNAVGFGISRIYKK